MGTERRRYQRWIGPARVGKTIISPQADECSSFFLCVTPTGLSNAYLPELNAAENLLLRLSQPPKLSTSARDAIILQRYSAGETLEDLARAYGITFQRVHQIILEGRQRQASA